MAARAAQRFDAAFLAAGRCSPSVGLVGLLALPLLRRRARRSQYDCRVHAQLDLLPHVGERAGTGSADFSPLD